MIEQLILHLAGDYVTQSDWMAQEKTKKMWPAFVHATVYSLPFLLIASPLAVLVIWITHLIIDRFRLAKYVAYAKNFLAPRWYWHKWSDCNQTGYVNTTPAWLAVWLMIACDNVMHLAINYLAIRYL